MAVLLGMGRSVVWESAVIAGSCKRITGDKGVDTGHNTAQPLAGCAEAVSKILRERCVMSSRQLHQQ